MRLAIVATHPIQYYAPLYRALAERIDIVVFFAHRATPADQSRAGFGVGFEWDVDLLSGYANVFLRNVATHPGLGRFSGVDTPEIAARLRDGKFDAVLVQGWNLKSLIQAAVAARRQRLPLLVRGDSHLDTPRSWLKKFAKAATYPALLRFFDAALYVGKRSHAYWRHYRYPEARLFSSPHCVDTDWFASRATAEAGAALRATLGIGPRTKVALFAGKLVPFKRPLDLVRAVAELNKGGRDVAMLVAGSGELEDEMTALAKASGVALHRLGFRNQTEMPAAYAAADVLVLPSDGRETWGLVANEALACGTPIVLSREVGAAPDLAEDKTAGRTFPLGDIGALSGAIAAVLDNPPSVASMAARSASYSLDAAADGIVRAAAFAVSRHGRVIV